MRECICGILMCFSSILITNGQDLDVAKIDSFAFFTEYADLTFARSIKVESEYADEGYWDVDIKGLVDTNSATVLLNELWFLDSARPLIYNTYITIDYGFTGLTIDRELIVSSLKANRKEYLSKYLEVYGTVLQTGKIWSEKDKLYIDCSFSVPFTDLGIPITVIADLSMDRLTIEYDL